LKGIYLIDKQAIYILIYIKHYLPVKVLKSER